MSLMMFVHGFEVLQLCKGVGVPCLWYFGANVVNPFGGKESALDGFWPGWVVVVRCDEGT